MSESAPIIPAVPHDDLVVTHAVMDGETLPEGSLPRYLLALKNPDGSTVALAAFHKGSPVEGWHGWTTAKMIEGLIKHMEYHQSTSFACSENEEILGHLRAAHAATEKRRDERKERGVLYDTEKP